MAAPDTGSETAPETMSVTEFKKHCLAVLSDIAAHKIDRLVITKRGKPIAEVAPAADEELPSLYGSMKGTVTIPEGVDLSEIDVDEPLDAEQGILYR